MTDLDRDLLRRVSELYPHVGRIDPGSADRAIARAVTGRHARRSSGAGMLAPASLAAAAAGLLFLGAVLGWMLRSRDLSRRVPANAWPREGASLSATREVRIIQFVLAAPAAGRVSVAGDFNDWSPVATPLHRATGGVWVAAIPLAPGRHVYAFIVDGASWVPDPAAPLAPEDGFGSRNSVIVVGDPEPA